MKKSHKKLLVFQVIILLIFVLNSFVSNILKEYNFILFLILSLIVFKKLFGFERDRNRYTKDILFEIIIFLLTFFILFYLFGVVIGFARTDNYYNLYGLKTFLLPLTLTIILQEILRYMMLKKSEGSKLTFIMTVVLFIFLDVTEAVYYNSFNTSYDTFIFIALSLMPAMSNNIVCCYLTRICGYKPIILYLLITKLYIYLLPIIPNPDEYITAVINFIVPIFLSFKINSFLHKKKDEYTDRNYKKSNLILLILPIIMTIVTVYFTSGYFHYYAIAIASGSMSPKIEKGDVVVIEKMDDNFESLKKGQVIAFKYNDVMVVHRLIDVKKENGEYYFYTKGDANAEPDNYFLTEEMIIGSVNIRIPFIGLPTVWLNEM